MDTISRCSSRETSRTNSLNGTNSPRRSRQSLTNTPSASKRRWESRVVDDEKSSWDRVRLTHEEIESCDSSYYETQSASVESVLSPLGWNRTELHRVLTALEGTT